MTTNTTTRAASRAAGVAGNALLLTVFAVGLVVGAPFYWLLRIWERFDNYSLGKRGGEWR